MAKAQLYLCPGHGCICAQGTAVYVSRAQSQNASLANVTETHFNQTIVDRMYWAPIHQTGDAHCQVQKVEARDQEDVGEN